MDSEIDTSRIKKSELVELSKFVIYMKHLSSLKVRVHYGCEHPNSLNWSEFIMDAIHVIGFRAIVLCALLVAGVVRLARGWRSSEADHTIKPSPLEY
ncbi:HLA class I histocompatibility antigen, A-23 alpha chain [Gossypium arboreum]|uniref:HLA class I histocompatibility antigen, A-23 alpha chain n=1 Tax=Gossypium arboreum TaxID=29729 RepID=A0A0B0PKD5_GOSAR|nr:HLA class I histocompatibility antigen, A-23 alpha chain [Gossypium arboreum]